MKIAKIARLIGFIILILIPLSITTFVGFYSYDRYRNTWLPSYIESSLNTAEKIERVVRYDSVSYTLDPVFEYTDPNHMFKLVAYGRLVQSPSVTQYVDYVMYMYAIDFNELPEASKPKITIAYGLDQTSTISFNYETRFEDTEVTREIDAAATNKYMSYKITFAATVDMAGTIDFTIFKGSELTEDYLLLLEDSITGIIHHPSTFNNSALTISGYNQDIEAAGYLSYVIGKYIWWQSLISLVLSGALSYLFYLVWQVDTVTPSTRKKTNKK